MMANAAGLRLVETPLHTPPRQPHFPSLAQVPHSEKTYWRGMTIYTLEEPATHLYLVLKGRVKIVRSSPQGQQKITSIHYRGDIFGELALAGGSIEARRSDEAVALDTARVAEVRLNDFWQMVKNDPAALQNAVQYLSARLTVAQQEIAALVFENNQRRLAQALLDLSVAAERAGELSVRLTHEELAELIGSTREVVTGMMLEFRQRGLIDYKRGEVRPVATQLEEFLAQSVYFSS